MNKLQKTTITKENITIYQNTQSVIGRRDGIDVLMAIRAKADFYEQTLFIVYAKNHADDDDDNLIYLGSAFLDSRQVYFNYNENEYLSILDCDSITKMVESRLEPIIDKVNYSMGSYWDNY